MRAPPRRPEASPPRRAARPDRGHPPSHGHHGGHLAGRGRHWRTGGVPRGSPDLSDPAGRLDVACCCVMSCFVQTCSRSASNPNCATTSRDFAMNGTSTSAPGLVTSSRQHSTASSRPTSRRRTENPSPAGDPASSATAGAPCSTDPVSPRSRRTRAAPRSASPTTGAAPGRLRSPRSSPATRSASSSATPAGRRTSLLDTLSVAQALTAGGIDRDQAEVIANAMRKLAEQGDQLHGRPVQGRTRRGPHRDRQTGKPGSSAGWSGPCSRRRL